MKTKTAKVLPKTASEIGNGGIYRQFVRCGKSNCKCVNDEPHTAFYFFTRRNGKLLKFYVRKSAVADFAALIEQSTADRRRNRQSTKDSADALRQYRAELRNVAGTISDLRNRLNLN